MTLTVTLTRLGFEDDPMAAPHPQPDQHWLVAGIVAVVGTIGTVIGTVVGSLATRKKIDAEADKTGAEAEQIQVTAEISVSDAALRLVQDLRTDIQRVRDERDADQRRWREEIEQIKKAHHEEIGELKAINRELKAAYDEAILANHHLKNRCERLEARVNELMQASTLDAIPLPEGGFEEAGETL